MISRDAELIPGFTLRELSSFLSIAIVRALK